MIFRQLIHDDLGCAPDRDEWEQVRIPCAAGRAWYDLDEIPADLDPAAGLRQRLGVGEVLHVVDGGVPAWESSGGEIARPATTRSI